MHKNGTSVNHIDRQNIKPLTGGTKALKNWLQVSHGFKIFTQGLQDVVKAGITNQHKKLKQSLKDFPTCEDNCSKTEQELTKWCLTCTEWKKNLVRVGQAMERNIPWGETDSQKWPEDSWEVARVLCPTLVKNPEKSLSLIAITEILLCSGHFFVDCNMVYDLQKIYKKHTNDKLNGLNGYLNDEEKDTAFEKMLSIIKEPQIYENISARNSYLKLKDWQQKNLCSLSEENLLKLIESRDKTLGKNTAIIVNDKFQFMRFLFCFLLGVLFIPTLQQLVHVPHLIKTLMAIIVVLRPIQSDLSSKGCPLENSFGLHSTKEFSFLPDLESHRNFTGREWLLDDLKVAIDSNQSVLIGAPPGVGTSAFSSAVVCGYPASKEIEFPEVIGYHFCKFDEPVTQNPALFIRNVADMISRRIPEYGAKMIRDSQLQQYIEYDVCLSQIDECFKKAILQPLISLQYPPKLSKIILIDSLHQCVSRRFGAALSNLVLTHSRHFPKWLKLIGTTDPDVDFMSLPWHQTSKLSIVPSDERNLHDIHLFTSHTCLRELDRHFIPNCRDFVNHLVQKSQGRFLFVTETIKFLKTFPIERAYQLQAGFESIDDMYQATFDILEEDMKYNTIRPVLEMYLASYEYGMVNSKDYLAEMLADLENQSDVEIPFLTGRNKNPNNHKSFLDWLQKKSHDYYIDITNGHQRIGSKLLRDFRQIIHQHKTDPKTKANHSKFQHMEALVYHVSKSENEDYEKEYFELPSQEVVEFSALEPSLDRKELELILHHSVKAVDFKSALYIAVYTRSVATLQGLCLYNQTQCSALMGSSYQMPYGDKGNLLHIGAQLGFFEIVQYVFQMNSETLYGVTEKGLTVWDLALQQECYNVVVYLCQIDIHISEICKDIRDSRMQKTALKSPYMMIVSDNVDALNFDDIKIVSDDVIEIIERKPITDFPFDELKESLIKEDNNKQMTSIDGKNHIITSISSPRHQRELLNIAVLSGNQLLTKQILKTRSIMINEHIQEIYVACMEGNIAVIQKYLFMRQNLFEEMDPVFIFIATLFRQVSLVEMILEARPENGWLSFMSSEEKNSQEIWYPCLAIAVDQNYPELTRLFIKYFPSALNHVHLPMNLTAIELAVVHDRVEIFQILFDLEADLKHKSKLDRSILHLMSMNGNTEMARILLNTREGGDLVKYRDKNGLAPYHTAALFGHVDILQVYVEEFGTSLLDDGKMLVLAVHANQKTVVDCLIQNDIQQEKWCKIDPRSEGIKCIDAVMLAISLGQSDILDTIVTHFSPNLKDTVVSQGLNALQLAVLTNHSEIFLKLQDKKVNLCTLTQSSKNLLHIAAQMGNVKIAQVLLSKQPQLAQGKEVSGLLPFDWAAATGHVTLMEILAPIVFEDGMGLIQAAGSGNLQAVEFMIDKGVVNSSMPCINHITSDNQQKNAYTILHAGILSRKLDLVVLLIEHFPDLVYTLDCAGRNVLDYATILKVENILEFLVSKGVPYSRSNLHTAAQVNSVDLVKKIFEKNSSLMELEDVEFVLDLKSNDTWSSFTKEHLSWLATSIPGIGKHHLNHQYNFKAYHWAAAQGYLDIYKGLTRPASVSDGLELFLSARFGHISILSHILSLNTSSPWLSCETLSPNPQCLSILHIAAVHGNVEIINLTLHQFPDLTLGQYHGRHLLKSQDVTLPKPTIQAQKHIIYDVLSYPLLEPTPLELAVIFNHTDAALILLKSAINYKQNLTNKPVLHFAIKLNNLEIVKALLEYDLSLANETNAFSMSPSNTAMFYGNMELVRLLGTYTSFDDGRNLHLAVSYRDLNTVRNLLKKKMIKYTTNVGNHFETVLHAAAFHGRSQGVIDLITGNFPDILNKPNQDGATALQVAIEGPQSEDAAIYLLKLKATFQSGLLVDVLTAAIVNQRVETVRYILKNHSHVAMETTEEGLYPFHVAAQAYFDPEKPASDNIVKEVAKFTKLEDPRLFQVAIQHGYQGALDYLLNHGITAEHFCGNHEDNSPISSNKNCDEILFTIATESSGSVLKILLNQEKYNILENEEISKIVSNLAIEKGNWHLVFAAIDAGLDTGILSNESQWLIFWAYVRYYLIILACVMAVAVGVLCGIVFLKCCCSLIL